MAVSPNNQMNVAGPIRENDIVLRASEIGETIPGIASLAMKQARKGAQRGIQGMYQIPEREAPTPEYMNISQQNLNNQNRTMVNDLNAIAPMGERLAYINDDEASILRLLGGSGEMTPAGIPSFQPQGNPMGAGTDGSSSSNGGGGNNDGDDSNGDDSNGDDPNRGFLGNTPGLGFDPSVGSIGTDPEGVEGGFQGPDAETLEADAQVTYSGGLVTGGGGLVAAGGALSAHRDKMALEAAQEDAIRSMIQAEEAKEVNPTASSVAAFSQNMQDRLGTLKDKAEDNDISVAELDEMGQLNSFFGESPATGMGIMQNLTYNFTSTDFKSDLADLGNILGTIMGIAGLIYGGPLAKLSSAMKLSKKFSKPKPMSISDLPDVGEDAAEGEGEDESSMPGVVSAIGSALAGLRSYGQISSGHPVGIVSGVLGLNQIAQDVSEGEYGYNIGEAISPSAIAGYLGIGDDPTSESAATMYSGLPSNYSGLGVANQGRGRERDSRIIPEELIDAIEEEEEDASEVDRFERAFANRYYTGPVTLGEIRKYATQGGYSQLSPYGVANA